MKPTAGSHVVYVLMKLVLKQLAKQLFGRKSAENIFDHQFIFFPTFIY